MTQQYGDYEVESFLGKGSIGKVYLARHRRIGRRVALKTVHLEQKFEDDDDQSEFYKRLQREAELCGSIQHPNVVTLYDVGYENDRVTYLATEYVDGESLLARLRRTRPLPLDEALSIATDLLRGLAYAHSKGIIHRDIKPANILLTSDGHAKIADFGVARPLHSSLTATRSLVGTPNYMSPEQVKTAPVSTRSDLFSAGAVLHEMLTGLKPFGAPELSGILYNVVNLVPSAVHQTNPDVPAAVARVVTKLLEKKPENRYATADEALADLEAARKARKALDPLDTVAIGPGDATTVLPTIVAPGRAPLYRRRIPPLVFWCVTLLLAAALAGSVMTLRRRIDGQKPVGVISAEQLRDADAKRESLEAARGLAYAGKYEEAIRAYDIHLTRFPEALAAREERGRVQQRLDALKAAEAEEKEPRVARKPRRTTVAEEVPPAEEKKLSRWQRFRRWLNEDPSKPREEKKD